MYNLNSKMRTVTINQRAKKEFAGDLRVMARIAKTDKSIVKFVIVRQIERKLLKSFEIKMNQAINRIVKHKNS